MNINDAFPSKYLKASDLQGQPADLVIREIKIEDVDDEEARPIVYFSNAQKGLCLNRTNAQMIAAYYGDETAAWAGKPITVFPDKTPFKGKIVDCIRVRVTPPVTTTAAPAATRTL